MAKPNKTSLNSSDPMTFLQAAATTTQLPDCLQIVQLLQEATGHPPRMWGDAIVGFGQYHYKYESGREADFMLVGFAPRKSGISLYIYAHIPANEALLPQLGKYKMGRSCITIQQLQHINTAVMQQIAQQTMAHLQAKWPSPGT